MTTNRSLVSTTLSELIVGGAEKTDPVQQFFEHHLKFVTIFENILRKSGTP